MGSKPELADRQRPAPAELPSGSAPAYPGASGHVLTRPPLSTPLAGQSQPARLISSTLREEPPLREASLAERGVDAHFAAFLDSGPPAYIADREGRIIYETPGYAAIAKQLHPGPVKAGYGLLSAGELTALANDEPLLRREHSLVAGQQSQPCIVEHRPLRRPQDAKPPAGGTLQPPHFPGYPAPLEGVVGQVLPRGEIEQALGALTLAQERLDDITRLVSDWIWETDRTLVFTFLSPRVSQALGFHPLELIGRPMSALSPEIALERGFDEHRPRPFRDREAIIADKQGRKRTFLLSGLPIFAHDDGRFLGFRGTAQDITELVQRERALRAAKEAAESANRAKSQFLANMSHELRTPLNAIIGFSEIMHSQIFGPVENRQYQEYTGDILESARHLLTLINDVLDVAKIEAGKFELHEESVDPALLVEQAVRTLAERAERAGLTLDVSVAQPGPLLQGDARKLRQVLLNLLSNAVKFTTPGGQVTLRAGPVESDTPEAQTDPFAPRNFAFHIEDNGIGMSESDLEVALQPFAQVDSALSRRHDGTGLGLPLARALTELHGGRLEIDSRPGSGTKVSVILPADRVLAVRL